MMLLLAACGGGSEESTGLPPAPGGGDAAAPSGPPVAATATLTGKIIFEGTAPAPKKIQMSADPNCQKSNPNAVDQAVVVSDGGLENVIIHISSGLEGKSFPTPSESPVLDQKGCTYTPRVLTVQTKQPIKIRNSDMTLHNIHAWAEKNKPFNSSQREGLEFERTFDTAEIVPIKCDVHSWMQAFVGVFPHPFHTVSKSGGAYELKLPAGKYEITAWHEQFGEQKQTIEVADGQTAKLDFTFKGKSAD